MLAALRVFTTCPVFGAMNLRVISVARSSPLRVPVTRKSTPESLDRTVGLRGSAPSAAPANCRSITRNRPRVCNASASSTLARSSIPAISVSACRFWISHNSTAGFPSAQAAAAVSRLNMNSIATMHCLVIAQFLKGFSSREAASLPLAVCRGKSCRPPVVDLQVRYRISLTDRWAQFFSST